MLMKLNPLVLVCARNFGFNHVGGPSEPDPDTGPRRLTMIASICVAVPQDAVLNARERTSLSKMGTESSARLLHHAYVLAMSNLHVALDYPFLAVPDRERFVRLVR